ncbi:uncharacterized protein LOC114604991 isoform X2 [Podarcis muralis]
MAWDWDSGSEPEETQSAPDPLPQASSEPSLGPDPEESQSVQVPLQQTPAGPSQGPEPTLAPDAGITSLPSPGPSVRAAPLLVWSGEAEAAPGSSNPPTSPKLQRLRSERRRDLSTCRRSARLQAKQGGSAYLLPEEDGPGKNDDDIVLEDLEGEQGPIFCEQQDSSRRRWRKSSSIRGAQEMPRKTRRQCLFPRICSVYIRKSLKHLVKVFPARA